MDLCTCVYNTHEAKAWASPTNISHTERCRVSPTQSSTLITPLKSKVLAFETNLHHKRGERSQAQGIVVWAAISTPREAVARAGVKIGILFGPPGKQ